MKPAKLGIILTGLLGAGLFVYGNWINMKAVAAGYMLEAAWQESLETQYPATLWGSMDAGLFGKLTVPGQDVEQVVLDRSTGQALAFAPAFIEESDWPGFGGTTAIAAHKNTHFQFLEYLKPGETVSLQSISGKTHNYVVEKAFIVDTRHEELSLSEEGDQLLLITCYPFNSPGFNGPLRYVVSAKATS